MQQDLTTLVITRTPSADILNFMILILKKDAKGRQSPLIPHAAIEDLLT